MALKVIIKNKSNFSFSKAVSELKSLEKDYIDTIAKSVVSEAKQRIEKSDIRPLTTFTKRMRKEGKYWGGKHGNQYKTNSEKPLIHTGRLLNSIEVKGKGISMIRYAKTHNDGWKSGGKWTGKIEPREFLVYDEAEARHEKAGFRKSKKKLVNSINKVMKKKK